jgi:hypothetical protein
MPRMALSGLDETLMHQASWPFRMAGVSDQRFFDRHWYSLVDPAQSLGLLSGMAFYKNMGVCDGYVAVQAGRDQYNVRFSRELGDDVDRFRVGDLEFTIVEPFRRIQISLSGESSPMSAKLTWTSDFPPYLEAHALDVPAGRVQQDASRYDQVGRWSGWVDTGSGGRRTIRDAWGVRDHSWGVRPGVGGFDRSMADPSTATATPGSPRAPMLYLVMYCQIDDLFIGLHHRENAEGETLYEDGEALWRDGRTCDVATVEFEIDFIPNSRAYTEIRATVILEDGQHFDIVATPVLNAWAYTGTGYDGGYWDGKGLGAWRGTVVEHDHYVHVPPEGVLRDGQPTPAGHREQPSIITVNGRPGMGYVPMMTRGVLPRYGLT